MISTMPLPKVTGGIRLAKVRIAAEAIAGLNIADIAVTTISGHPTIIGRTGTSGHYAYVALNLDDRTSTAYTGSVSGFNWAPMPGQEKQISNALEQGKIPAFMERAETNPTWIQSEATTWRFKPMASGPGAAGKFLDEWGRWLQVPRYLSESDADYAKRIVSEAMAPSTTNRGLAKLLEDMLGVPVVVQDAEGWVKIWNFDSIEYFDTTDLTFIAETTGFDGHPTCLFFILIGADPPISDSDIARVSDLANRRRAAGTRLGGVFGTGAV